MIASIGSMPRLAVVCLAVFSAFPLTAETSDIQALSVTGMEASLAQAPMAGSKQTAQRPVVLLPTANGRMGRFAVEEVQVMEAGLAARFPRIRTYRAIGLDDPTAIARLDLTPQGFHAMVLSPAGTVLVEPEEGQPLKRSRVVPALRKPKEGQPLHRSRVILPDRTPASSPWQCATPDRPRDDGHQPPALRSARAIAGTQIRTYRIAIATTGEYTAFHGGTVESGLAEVVTVLNRVVGILERDVAIRLILVDGNDRLIYTDAENDPYNNDDPEEMLVQNQENLDEIIGTRNYDIGHLFGTYPQGRGDGPACIRTYKAMGYSGLPRPRTEFFTTQLVVHEIGHQFYASHTFNTTAAGCGQYRYGPTAWEPGSGSTIMSYAGVCGEENVARRGGDHFHTGSQDEILDYVRFFEGATCGTVAPSGNRPPIANAGRRHRIPAETPFALVGEGSDPDGDTLTYVWEQFDLGPPSPPMADDGERPLFRSYPPVSEPIRIIPRVRDLRRGRATIKEILPTTTRDLTFRLTVRDGRGGVARDTVKLQVESDAGPFRVLEPRKGDRWTIGGRETVEWDVADTDLQPIRCRRVDLWLSIDAGRTFPIQLLAGTANDGLANVTVPSLPTGRARIKVACANNIFFAISEGNFKIRQ